MSVNNDEPKDLTTNQARSGETPGIVRYVLLISLALIVVLFLGLVFLYR